MCSTRCVGLIVGLLGVISVVSGQELRAPLKWTKELPRELRELDKKPIEWKDRSKPVWLRNDQLKTRPGWKDHNELPVWAQRGKVNFTRAAPGRLGSVEALQLAVDSGITHFHGREGGYGRGYKTEVVEFCKKWKLTVGMRSEGVMFFGYDDNPRLHAAGYRAYHSYAHNINWFRKFPEVMMGTAWTREGHTLTEYHGSKWVERYLGAIKSPHFRKMRELYMAGYFSKKPIFTGEKCPGMELDINTIWLDNPLPTVASFDPFTVQAFQEQFETWFGRPFYDPAAHPDPLVRRAWNHYAARSISDYYRWNRDLIQRLAGRQVTQSANLHTQLPFSTWEMWLLNQGAMDFMDNEESTRYNSSDWTQSSRYFVGYKMALAAGNGRAVLRHFGNIPHKAESMACLCSSSSKMPSGGYGHRITPGVKKDPGKPSDIPLQFLLNKFLLRHQEIFGNAQPGGRLAVLYHLRRSLENSQITKLVLMGRILQHLGVPFEVITEDDLTQPALAIYDAVLIPGIPVMPQEASVLEKFCRRGGKLLLVGDCRAGFSDTPLSETLGGPSEWKDVVFACGAGKVAVLEKQIPQEEAFQKALDDVAFNSCRFAAPDKDLFLNITYQPINDKRFGRSPARAESRRYTRKDSDYPFFKLTPLSGNLLALHVVNYGGEVRQNVDILLTEDTMRRFPYAALLRPDYTADKLEFISLKRGRGVRLTKVGLYSVVILCADSNDRDNLVSKERRSWLTPTPRVMPWGKLPELAGSTSLQPESGRRQCLLISAGESPRRGFVGRWTYPPQAEAGKAFKVRLDNLRGHIWNRLARLYDCKLVFIRKTDGKRIESAAPEMEGKRLSDFADRNIELTPSLPEKGDWQAYWHYRLVSDVMDGTVGRVLWGGKYHLKGEPRLAIPYTERLERFVVKVK